MTRDHPRLLLDTPKFGGGVGKRRAVLPSSLTHTRRGVGARRRSWFSGAGTRKARCFRKPRSSRANLPCRVAPRRATGDGKGGGGKGGGGKGGGGKGGGGAGAGKKPPKAELPKQELPKPPPRDLPNERTWAAPPRVRAVAGSGALLHCITISLIGILVILIMPRVQAVAGSSGLNSLSAAAAAAAARAPVSPRMSSGEYADAVIRVGEAYQAVCPPDPALAAARCPGSPDRPAELLRLEVSPLREPPPTLPTASELKAADEAEAAAAAAAAAAAHTLRPPRTEAAEGAGGRGEEEEEVWPRPRSGAVPLLRTAASSRPEVWTGRGRRGRSASAAARRGGGRVRVGDGDRAGG